VKPGEEETKPNELVIIRRRASGDEAGHKGGVWKIAYADFMTAMMAFFLVMWLINSTDKKVLVQVANYFNPVRLTDNTPAPKGLHDVETGAKGKQGAVGNSKEEDGKAKSDHPAEAGKPKYTEQALFSDPYGALASLAADAKKQATPPPPKSKDGGDASVGGGTSFRDPFDPAFRRDASKADTEHPPVAPQPEAKAAAPRDAAKPDTDGRQAPPRPEPKAAASSDADKSDTEPPQGAPPPEPKVAAVDPAKPDAEPPQAAPRPEPKSGGATALDRAEDSAAAADAKKPVKDAQDHQATAKKADRDEAAKLEKDIKAALEHALPGTIPHIDVSVTEEGVLISLTDDYDFGMFAIASAEPRPAMVVLMEKIAKILAAHPQKLVVRGHTDGRPYRSSTYDNWRLSTARAHMAYYMLVRGGVEEKRFDRIEGYADRNLRVASDPEAARNRRIEILLRRAKP
jgi:chemotaxis protein MotB